MEHSPIPSRRLLLTAASATGIALVAACAPKEAASATTGAPSAKAVELRIAMRKLWEDHITYTRNFIISDLAGLGDVQAVTDRLLKNQDDIGAAVAPYYGEAAGTQLTQLLRGHIVIAGDVVNAAKAGDKATLDAKQKAWSANGVEIATFLSGANPNWSKDELTSMLQRHLDLTSGEVVGRLGKDWAADIKSYDEGHEHMLMFADALTNGIVKQFPDKFA